MRTELQHKTVQSRTIESPKQKGAGAIPMVDNRDTVQMRVVDVIQRMGLEEEEPLQGKFETIQQQKPNNTGLPDNLKSGVENLSGFSMDDVRVHYNSDKPAQIQAHAYTQGSEIHVAPGQEKHLPHEAWHAVQQMQGRVQPTVQMQGVNVNDNTSLENEADAMGWRAVQTKINQKLTLQKLVNTNANHNITKNGVLQKWGKLCKRHVQGIDNRCTFPWLVGLTGRAYHAHFFFDKAHKLPTGTKEDIGFGNDELYSGENIAGYHESEDISNGGHDLILVQAITDNRNPGGYSLLRNNCQDWARKVKNTYNGLRPFYEV